MNKYVFLHFLQHTVKYMVNSLGTKTISLKEWADSQSMNLSSNIPAGPAVVPLSLVFSQFQVPTLRRSKWLPVTLGCSNRPHFAVLNASPQCFLRFLGVYLACCGSIDGLGSKSPLLEILLDSCATHFLSSNHGEGSGLNILLPTTMQMCSSPFRGTEAHRQSLALQVYSALYFLPIWRGTPAAAEVRDNLEEGTVNCEKHQLLAASDLDCT